MDDGFGFLPVVERRRLLPLSLFSCLLGVAAVVGWTCKKDESPSGVGRPNVHQRLFLAGQNTRPEHHYVWVRRFPSVSPTKFCSWEPTQLNSRAQLAKLKISLTRRGSLNTELRWSMVCVHMQVLVAGRWSLGCGAAVSLRRRGSSGIAVNGIGRWQDACCPAHHVNDD
jgi:hypothetical protein